MTLPRSCPRCCAVNRQPSTNRQSMLIRAEGYHLERVAPETIAAHSLTFSFSL